MGENKPRNKLGDKRNRSFAKRRRDGGEGVIHFWTGLTGLSGFSDFSDAIQSS
jgi:hypothetical protein